MNIVKIDCSGCLLPVKVNIDTGVVSAKIPSNGKRGSLHVPAHTATDTVIVGDDLAFWDCPICGYADSTYVDPATRKALS